MSVVHSPEISIAVFSLNLGELDLPSYAGVFWKSFVYRAGALEPPTSLIRVSYPALREILPIYKL